MKISSHGISSKFSWLLLLSILILVISNLYLTKIPLTNTLGYELSAINGILLFLLSGFLAIKTCREENKKTFVLLLNDNKTTFIIINTIPFLISLISSIIVSKCPITDGVLFYLTITIPASFFGLVTGFFSVALSKKYSILFFLLIFFLILFSAAIELIIYPQIYFYNPIFGFYPGTIYDEDLSVDKVLIAYRIFNVAFFIGLISISEYLIYRNKIIKILATLLLITIIVAFSYLKPILNFATDVNRIQSNLNKQVRTESFQIHFSNSMEENEVEYAAILHEYFLDQIKVSLRLNENKRIDSYIFRDRKQKRLIIGAGNADIAKPWLNQIYLNSSNYEETLKHELVHVLGGEFGASLFKIAGDFNPSMIEGLAMAFENNYDGYPVHYMAKLADQSGYKFPIEKLFSGLNFFTKTSAISYIYSGSFLKYLSDKYGVDKIKILYNSANFQKIFGKDIPTLALEYDDFMKSYQINFDKYKAQFYFGGTTIFKKFCPRVAAADVKKGWELYSKQKIDEALKLFQKVFQYSNSYQSISGIIACYSKEKKYVKAEKFLSKQLPNFKLSQYYFSLELGYGDLLIKCNDSLKAVDIYDSLLIQNPHVQYTNEVMIRKNILEKGIDSLKNYFGANETIQYQKLLKMNSIEINYFSIPTLLHSAERINCEIKELFSMIKKKIKVNDQISSYAALEISRLALKRSDYETAQYFAVLALIFKQDSNLSHKYVENLRMVNWFKNNAEDLKSTFKYNQ